MRLKDAATGAARARQAGAISPYNILEIRTGVRCSLALFSYILWRATLPCFRSGSDKRLFRYTNHIFEWMKHLCSIIVPRLQSHWPGILFDIKKRFHSQLLRSRMPHLFHSASQKYCWVRLTFKNWQPCMVPIALKRCLTLGRWVVYAWRCSDRAEIWVILEWLNEPTTCISISQLNGSFWMSIFWILYNLNLNV